MKFILHSSKGKKKKKTFRYGKCGLCDKKKVLKLSHRIPKFVARSIKDKSFTKKLRNPNDLKLSYQDSDKEYLLCGNCEGLFSKNETSFANTVFHPYRDENLRQDSFCYDESIFYFMTSLAWRTMYRDARDKKKTLELGFKENQFRKLCIVEDEMKEFLKGNLKKVKNFKHHLIFLNEKTKFQSIDGTVNQLNYYSSFYRGTFGYLFGNQSDNSLYIFHNLAGILLITVFKGGAKEKYNNTQIYNRNGEIKENQVVQSRIVNEMMYNYRKVRESRSDLPESVRKQIENRAKADPEGFKKAAASKNESIIIRN